MRWLRSEWPMVTVLARRQSMASQFHTCLSIVSSNGFQLSSVGLEFGTNSTTIALMTTSLIWTTDRVVTAGVAASSCLEMARKC